MEDEELLRNGLCTCVEWEYLGYKILAALENGEECLQYLNMIPRENFPSLIISDIRMPRIDGIEMLERIRTKWKTMHFIIITGYDEFEYAKKAVTLGVYEYILKPVNLEQLNNTLQSLERKIKNENEQTNKLIQLQNMEHENMHLLRQKIYASLLLENGKLEDLFFKIEKLSEPALDLFYSVAIIETENIVSQSMNNDYIELLEMDRVFEGRIQKILSKLKEKNNSGAMDESGFEILRSGNGERLICIREKNPQSIHFLSQQLMDVINKNSENEISALQITFGTVQKGLDGMIMSYKNAYEKNEEKMTQNNIKFFLQNMEQDDLQFDSSKILYQIRNGTEEGLHSCIKEWELYLKERNLNSYIQTVYEVSKLYSQIIHLPELEGISAKNILGDTRERYIAIVEKKKTSFMIDEIEKIALEVQKYINNDPGSRLQTVVNQTKEFIENNYMRNITIKNAADHVFLSSSYLSSVLKKETGQTYIELLTNCRIKHAKHLLKTTELVNSEVAFKSGYINSTYFSTVFKSITGKSPSVWRKENSEE